MSRLLLFCSVPLCAASFFLISSMAHATRIGYVDLRKALNEVEDGRLAKAKLQKKKTRFQSQLNLEKKRLKKEKKNFDRRSAILSSNAKVKAQKKLQKKFFRLQKLYTKLTRQLAREEAVEMRKIIRKMQAIIRGIAIQNKLDLMLEKTESSEINAQTTKKK
ncbi:MAG: OmpH family outer membrane protein, partial [Myxococcota bacterium]